MQSNTNQASHRQGLTLDYRLIVVALLLVIAGMLVLWRPWEGRSDRTVQVTGQSTVIATPDEFVFYPTYEFKNAEKSTALAALSAKSEEIVKKVKELGVPDNKIKTSSNGYDYPVYKDTDRSTPTYTLSITISTDADHVQKVQDYLLSTAPTGNVSPQATFSDAKRRELENKARDEATKDARTKAEQSAKNLGFGLGAIKTVDDAAGFGGIVYPGRGVMATDVATPEVKQLTVQPGENELSYSVTVTYFVR